MNTCYDRLPRLISGNQKSHKLSGGLFAVFAKGGISVTCPSFALDKAGRPPCPAAPNKTYVATLTRGRMGVELPPFLVT